MSATESKTDDLKPLVGQSISALQQKLDEISLKLDKQELQHAEDKKKSRWKRAMQFI